MSYFFLKLRTIPQLHSSSKWQKMCLSLYLPIIVVNATTLKQLQKLPLKVDYL